MELVNCNGGGGVLLDHGEVAGVGFKQLFLLFLACLGYQHTCTINEQSEERRDCLELGYLTACWRPHWRRWIGGTLLYRVTLKMDSNVESDIKFHKNGTDREVDWLYVFTKNQQQSCLKCAFPGFGATRTSLGSTGKAFPTSQRLPLSLYAG